jgi:hypothetical protein|eukprot:SAG25_NODE_10_length_28450_cov_12.738775_3_plen_69_part_00
MILIVREVTIHIRFKATFLTLAKLYFGLPWRELRIRLESSVLSVSLCTLSGEGTISKNLYCVARSRIG